MSAPHPYSDSVVTRLRRYTDSTGEGCWPFMLTPDPQGYGQLNVGNKRVVRAHRLSYEINVGPIPEGMVVMHICDNRICVRPSHLRLGTAAENLADCRAKGRWHNHKKAARERVGKKGPVPKPLAERFWPKVGESDEAGCRHFRGYLDSRGYGLFFVPGLGRNGSKRYAHRIAYELTYGAIPDGMVVMHRCDQPSCCNPAHLMLGTLADNNRDRSAKGRGRESRQWGAANPRAQLTAEQVLEIRKLAASGVSQGRIAKMFGIKQPQVSRIVRGISWPDGPWS